MARQTYYVTREQKHPLYRTRMLQAGPIELDASAARLYEKLGVELSDQAPKRAASPAPAPAPVPSTEIKPGKPGGSKPGTTAKKKAARRKKTA